jgi:hypothetical protein
MTSRKERIAAMLDKLDGNMLDELEEALEDVEPAAPAPTQHEITTKKPNRRRGRGKKRRSEDAELHLEEEEARPKSRRGKRGKSKSRTKQSRVVKGQQCRTIAYDTDSRRPNKFTDMLRDANLAPDEAEELKAAAKADKKRKKKGFRTGKRPNPMVWARCRSCGEEEEVAASFVHDPKSSACWNLSLWWRSVL